MNRTTIALIAVLCMAMVALVPAAIPTGTSSPSGNATSTEHQFHPFTGTPSTIPGQIEAENYDTGGQSVAWFDRTPGNRGGAYREDDVDIETGGSGHVVAFVKSSEWLTYTVDVQEAGTYMATFRASSPWADREVWVWVDGVLKAQVRVPDTKSFDTYGNATANVTLPAGSHYIRLQFVGDAQNLDYMTFEMATGTGGTESTPTPTITSTLTPTPTGNQTIVQLASGDPNLSTLVTAVKAAGLVETLNGTGPFTVFAPTNAAFSALPAGTLDGLLQNKTALAAVLTYHVAGERLPAVDVVNKSSIMTVQGSALPVTVLAGGRVMVDGANVTRTDILASNGVIHLIDAVMIPPTPTGNQTIVQLASGDPNLSTLVTAVKAAGLVETLNGTGPFTVFAPTNAAFSALPAGTLDGLLQNKTALAAVLTYHVAGERLPAVDVVNKSSIMTVQGSALPVTVLAGGRVMVDGANVTRTDILASNGVIHLIDAVMIPPARNATSAP